MNVLIIGCAGQDGYYLGESLARHGHAVFGIDRIGLIAPDGQRLRKCDVESQDDITAAISEISPDQIYYLAAFHHSSEQIEAHDASILKQSFLIHVSGLTNVLDALVSTAPECRLFYAASSRVFGVPRSSPQNENTPLNPICPYGISKTAGIHLINFYRQRGLYCCTGYLYNHESERRADNFVSRKITKAAVAIERGQSNELILGNIRAEVDWGYAPDYIEAMELILDLDQAEDFIIASGHSRLIQDFVEIAFNYTSLPWQDYVRVNPSVIRSTTESAPFVGDISKLQAKTGWKPKTGLEEMVHIMVDAERKNYPL